MEEIQKQWYILQALTGQEQKAQRQIVAQVRGAGLCEFFDIKPEVDKKEVLNDFNVVVPTEKVSEVKEGKKRIITRKVCPGYVIVHMALYKDAALKEINQDLYQFVQAIPGVIGILGGTRIKPRPITDQEAADLLHHDSAEKVAKPRPKVNFIIGETVRVTEGPFMNFPGTVEQIDPDSGKLQISVSIFGRNAPVSLEYWQVERFTATEA